MGSTDYPAVTRHADENRPLRLVMLATSYPLYPGDTTAPFIEELAAHIAALGHEVHVALPDHPRLRREPCERAARCAAARSPRRPGHGRWRRAGDYPALHLKRRERAGRAPRRGKSRRRRGGRR